MLRKIKILPPISSLINAVPLATQLTLVNASAVLLLLSFPYLDIWIFAWVALIPLLIALEGRNLMQAFALSYLCGVIFFTGTMYWLMHVTILGAFLMILYLALYFGIFGVFYSTISKRSVVSKMMMAPSAWVILEFIRDRFLTGFGWAFLGHSQYKVLPIIQIAEFTGVYGISFLIVMTNIFIKEILFPLIKGNDNNKKYRKQAAFITLIPLMISLLYGYFYINLMKVKGVNARVSIIQPNISQEDKWSRSLWPKLMDKILTLTESVVSEEADLIIWPETSYPGYMWESKELYEVMKERVAEHGIPLLFGAVTKPEKNYYNSAILLSGEGKEVKRYNKLHLVPFGEFIPLRGQFPFLQDIIPIADFTKGDEVTLFPFPETDIDMKEEKVFFSTLICFEDTIARVTRRFVNQGAEFLVNITNDAWFKDTIAPYLHLQSAVFRSVENRRELIRAANTGVSSMIDFHGRISDILKDSKGDETFSEGTLTESVVFLRDKTFYTRWGDIFVFLCMGAMGFCLIFKKD